MQPYQPLPPSHLGMQVPEMNSSEAIHELMSHLKTYRKQLQQKSTKETQHARMTQTLHIRDTLDHGTSLEVENLPGSLKYALAKEWVKEEAEAWLKVKKLHGGAWRMASSMQHGP